jgi:hypothetical protein
MTLKLLETIIYQLYPTISQLYPTAVRKPYTLTLQRPQGIGKITKNYGINHHLKGTWRVKVYIHTLYIVYKLHDICVNMMHV